jgi:hypothetical protein
LVGDWLKMAGLIHIAKAVDGLKIMIYMSVLGINSVLDAEVP